MAAVPTRNYVNGKSCRVLICAAGTPLVSDHCSGAENAASAEVRKRNVANPVAVLSTSLPRRQRRATTNQKLNVGLSHSCRLVVANVAAAPAESLPRLAVVRSAD